MKKKMSLTCTIIVMILVFSFSASAAGAIHPQYTPGDGLEAKVDGDAHKDVSSKTDNEIGTDFYIVDKQDEINTFQLKVEVPMYVSLVVVGDGEVAVPSSDAYGLRNFSGYAVNITGVTVDDPDGGWKLVNSLVDSKDIQVSLEGKNLLALDSGAESLTQIPKATTLAGEFKPYAITAKAHPSQVNDESGHQFSVSYALALAS